MIAVKTDAVAFSLSLRTNVLDDRPYEFDRWGNCATQRSEVAVTCGVGVHCGTELKQKPVASPDGELLRETP